MPELPEVEHLRRSLEPHLVGASVVGVDVRRRGIVRVAGTRRPVRLASDRMLLAGDRIRQLIRRGKSLAIVGEGGGVLGVHLGMTGMMRVVGCERDGETKRRRDEVGGRGPDRHVHCVWTMRCERAGMGAGTGVGGAEAHLRLVRDVGGSTMICAAGVRQPGEVFEVWFRDPRRFGGLFPFASIDDLHTHAGGWARLGPDALELTGELLRERLLRTAQPIKAALLNQALIAGVGNIYADESLHAAGIHPLTRPRRLGAEQWLLLAELIRTIMQRAIERGGSSVSDYVDGEGEPGTFGVEHQVYGRGGQACLRCGQTLAVSTVGQRTTVHCPQCQKRTPGQGVRAARHASRLSTRERSKISTMLVGRAAG